MLRKQYIYMIPVLGSPTPPPQWYPPPTRRLLKPNLCDCAHFSHEGLKTVICHEDRVPKTPDSCDSTNFPARFTREAAASTVTRIVSQTRPILVTVDTSHRINKATVARTAFPDKVTVGPLQPYGKLTKTVALRSSRREPLPGTRAEDTRRPTKETLKCLT